MKNAQSLFTRFVGEDTGQDLVEYGLLLGIITVACVATIVLIGPAIAGYFSDLEALLP